MCGIGYAATGKTLKSTLKVNLVYMAFEERLVMNKRNQKLGMECKNTMKRKFTESTRSCAVGCEL